MIDGLVMPHSHAYEGHPTKINLISQRNEMSNNDLVGDYIG